MTEDEIYSWVSYASSPTEGAEKRLRRIARALFYRYCETDEQYVETRYSELSRKLGMDEVSIYQMVRRGLALLRTAPRQRVMLLHPGIKKTQLWRGIQSDYLEAVR